MESVLLVVSAATFGPTHQSSVFLRHRSIVTMCSILFIYFIIFYIVCVFNAFSNVKLSVLHNEIEGAKICYKG